MSVYDRKIRTAPRVSDNANRFYNQESTTAAAPVSRQAMFARYVPTSSMGATTLESRIKQQAYAPTVNARMPVARYAEYEEEEYDVPEEHYQRTRTTSNVPSTTLPTKLSGGYVDVRRSSVASTASTNASTASIPTFNYGRVEVPKPVPTNLISDRSVASALTQMSNKGFSANSATFSVSMPHMNEQWLDVNRLPQSLRNGVTYLSLVRFPRLPKTTQRYLPPQTDFYKNKPTLVLDLDETLMHCSAERLPGSPPDLIVRFDDCSSVGYVYVRPYAKVFLENTAKFFELVIFTASTQPYADQVLSFLDPKGTLIPKSHRLYRPQCSEINGGYTKDLRLLGRDLTKTMLVDNSPISIALQMDNGILCDSFFGNNPADVELVETLQLLQEWLDTDTPVYRFLHDRYGFRAFINKMRIRDPMTNLTQ